MLGVGSEDLSDGYLLEWMALHRAGRAANVGGRSGVVCVEHCVILLLNRHLVLRLRRRCAGVRAWQWRVGTACWFMLRCVPFSVYCHAAGAHKCWMRCIRVLKSGSDWAAGALCIELGLGGS